MKINKRAGISLLTAGTLFFVGAYAQRCASVTDFLPTERIEETAKDLFGRDMESTARRFSSAVQDGIETEDVLYATEAVTDGMLALPESHRAGVVRAGIYTLNDSIAFDILRDRSRIREVPYR